MIFRERSYSSNIFLPSPEVHIEPDGSLGIVVTPWGQRSAARRAIELLSDFVSSAKDDMESTSPFQKMSCLSPLANHLRVGLMLVNDTLYREDNKSEYQSAIEICIFARNQSEIAYAQVGQPHLFLSRKNSNLIPLGIEIDSSVEWSQRPRLLHPLPNNVLGLYTTSNFMVRALKPQEGDELLFVSRQVLPTALYRTPPEKRNLDGLTEILTADHSRLPFWIGLHSLDQRPLSVSEQR